MQVDISSFLIIIFTSSLQQTLISDTTTPTITIIITITFTITATSSFHAYRIAPEDAIVAKFASL